MLPIIPIWFSLELVGSLWILYNILNRQRDMDPVFRLLWLITAVAANMFTAVLGTAAYYLFAVKRPRFVEPVFGWFYRRSVNARLALLCAPIAVIDFLAVSIFGAFAGRILFTLPGIAPVVTILGLALVGVLIGLLGARIA